MQALEQRRLLAAGVLDNSFDTDGKLIFNGGLGSGFDDVEVQPDGKVLAVGQFTGGPSRTYGLFRYNLNGTPDTTFGGGDGVATLPFTANFTNYEIFLQADGKIVVGGPSGAAGAGAARFTSAGLPDTTLNTVGYITVAVGTGSSNFAAVQPDGKILLAGGYSSGTTGLVRVHRFNVNGTPDRAFNSFVNPGISDTTLSSSAFMGDMIVQPSGKILIAGTDQLGDAFFIRLRADGSPDNDFAGGGKVEDVILDAYPTSLESLPDDSFVAAGAFSYPDFSKRSLLARFTTSGALNSSFGGGDGILQGALGSQYMALDVQLDGKMLLASYDLDFVIERLLPDGSPDNSFGSAGKATTNLDGADTAQAVTTAPDGRVVAAGWVKDALLAGIVRYTNEGVGVIDATGTLRVTTTDSQLVTITGVPGGFDVSFSTPGSPPYVTQRFPNTIKSVVLQDVAVFSSPSVLITGDFTQLPPSIDTEDGSSVSVFLTSGNDSVYIDDSLLIANAVHISLDANVIANVKTFGGNDYIHRFGGAGFDLLVDSGDDSDTIIIDPVTNSPQLSVRAGTGDDQVYFPAGKRSYATPAETLDGGTGVDRLRLEGDGGYDVFTFSATEIKGIHTVKHGGFESALISLAASGDELLIDSTVSIPVTIYGGDQSDTITAAGTGPVTIYGDAGDDTITGGKAADSLLGGDGNDTFKTLDGIKDTIDGGFGTDSLTGDSNEFFLNIESASIEFIRGRVFSDVNGNGAFDAGESGLAGRTVTISPAYTSVTTDSNGFYKFEGLASGTYVVSQVLPTGWEQTFPAGGSNHSVTVPMPATLNFNFGARLIGGPTQTPYQGLPFAISSTATTTIQLEDFDNGGDAVAWHDTTAGNAGGLYRTGVDVDLKAVSGDTGAYYISNTLGGEWTEYTIDVAAAGNYDLSFRLASGGAGGSFHVEIDGVNVTGSLTAPSTGGWQTWTTLKKTAVPLPAGTHVLRLFLESTGPTGAVANFNYLAVAPTPAVPPQTPFKGSPFAISKAGATTIEVEDFDNGGEGIAYHDVESSNLGAKYRLSEGVDIQSTTDPTGGVYNVGYTRAGEWLEYSINVTETGNYDLAFRVASAAAGGKFHVGIDGADVTSAMTVPSTGAWQNWTTINKTNVPLTAGAHILRLSMDAVGATGGVGNFNYIKISPTSTITPTILTTDTAAYVRDGIASTTKFSNDPQLQVKKDVVSFTRESYITFNIGSLATITSAKLRLFGATSTGSALSLGLFSTSSLDESTLTWITRPTTATPITNFTVSGATPKWYEIDITAFLQAQKAAGATSVTFAIKSNTSSSTMATFASDDAPNAPQIVVNS